MYIYVCIYIYIHIYNWKMLYETRRVDKKSPLTNFQDCQGCWQPSWTPLNFWKWTLKVEYCCNKQMDVWFCTQLTLYFNFLRLKSAVCHSKKRTRPQSFYPLESCEIFWIDCSCYNDQKFRRKTPENF